MAPIQALKAEILRDEDGEAVVLRLIGIEHVAGGTATLELTDEMMLVVDATIPTRVVEIAIAAEAGPHTEEMFQQVVGSRRDSIVDGDTIELEVGEILAVLGRLALLDLMRVNGPLITRKSLWLLERLQLVLKVPWLGQTQSTIEILAPYVKHLKQMAVLMGPEGSHLVALSAQLASENGEPPVQELVDKVCDRLRSWLSTTDPHIVGRGDFPKGQFSLEWEQLPAGILDPHESTIFVELDPETGAVEVWSPLLRERDPRSEVFARVWLLNDADPGAANDLISFPLEREGKRTLAGTKQDDRLVGRTVEQLLVEIGSESTAPFKSQRERARARGRRAAFWAASEARKLKMLLERADPSGKAELKQVGLKVLQHDFALAAASYTAAHMPNEASDAESLLALDLEDVPAIFMAELESLDPLALASSKPMLE